MGAGWPSRGQRQSLLSKRVMVRHVRVPYAKAGVWSKYRRDFHQWEYVRTGQY